MRATPIAGLTVLATLTVATGTAAQTTMASITGNVVVDASNVINPFNIADGDDLTITLSYATTMATGPISPGGDPTLMFLLDIFADGTMSSRFTTPFDQDDDIGFAGGFGPQFDLVNGNVDQVSFGGSGDPTILFNATDLTTATPNLLLTTLDGNDFLTFDVRDAVVSPSGSNF